MAEDSEVLTVEPGTKFRNQELESMISVRSILMKLLKNTKQVDTIIDSLKDKEPLFEIASKLPNTTYVEGSKTTNQGKIGEWCNNHFFDAKPWQPFAKREHTTIQGGSCWCRSWRAARQGSPRRHENGKTLVVTEQTSNNHKIFQEATRSKKFKPFALLNWNGHIYLAMVGLSEGIWRLWVGEIQIHEIDYPKNNSPAFSWRNKNEWAFGYNNANCGGTLGGFFANEYLLFNDFSIKTLNFPLGRV